MVPPPGVPAAVHAPDSPVGTLLASVRRGSRTTVPSGGAPLRPGDVMTLFAADGAALRQAEQALKERRLRGGGQST